MKIKNEETNTEITISNIYLEPDKERKYEETIPEAIRNADCIAGDLNKAETGWEIHSRIYHIFNLGEIIDTIHVDHKISDHPILIFRKRINIPLKDNSEYKTIIDNKRTEENNIKIYNLITTDTKTTNFIEPHKIIKTYAFECRPNNDNNWDNFEIIKKQNITI